MMEPQFQQMTKLNTISHLPSLENGRVFAASMAGRTDSHERFAKNPKQGEAMATDPVCGTEIDEKKAEFQTQFAGRKYYFCSDECRKEFEEQPEDFVETAAA
jgi:YHS domain-containing protein